MGSNGFIDFLIDFLGISGGPGGRDLGGAGGPRAGGGGALLRNVFFGVILTESGGGFCQGFWGDFGRKFGGILAGILVS